MQDNFPQGSLSYGQELVGFSFNPAVDPQLNYLKAQFAAIIDKLNDMRSETPTDEHKKALTEAIEKTNSAYLAAYAAIA